MNQCLRSCTLAASTLFAASLALVGAQVGTTAGAAAADAATPPGFSLTRTGSVHDFDFAAGAWTSRQQRLKARNVGSTAWEESPGNIHCASNFMDGVTTVDAAYSPAKRPAGLWLHIFDVAKRQWSVYWINPKTGRMDSGVVGGFDGVRGEFFGADEDNGKPVRVRYTWEAADHDHYTWTQAFSFDNRTWETNWKSDFTRADPAVCATKS
jgi:hypothetical protein